MPASNKIQKEQTQILEFSFYNNQDYAICKSGNSYRVYPCNSTYSSTSGQTFKLGKVERGLDGNILKFKSVSEADNWVRGGLKLSDNL